MKTKRLGAKKEELILDLYRIGAIKFGRFVLKSGKISPYYLDLRALCSYPYVLKKVATEFKKGLVKLKYDLIVAVPYTAIPIASAIAILFNKRMIFTRKEVKDHGTRKLIEGVFKPKEKGVVIDDVISDGASKLETIDKLKAEGLTVKDIIVLLDRGQGGPENMKSKGYHCYSLININDIISILGKHKKINATQVKEAKLFLEGKEV